VSGPDRVDVARLAAVAAEPDIRRATAREADELTGFTIGGIPPIGHIQPVRVIMDPHLGRHPTVWAAAGLPTTVFEVPPATLRTLANATVAPITEERRAADVEAAGAGVADVEAAGASDGGASGPLTAQGSGA
jgi:prolyl-tRNA editing enzyme YbaK/EbsC (Cys-tRNA(Pro) deacylase)